MLQKHFYSLIQIYNLKKKINILKTASQLNDVLANYGLGHRTAPDWHNCRNFKRLRCRGKKKGESKKKNHLRHQQQTELRAVFLPDKEDGV